MNVVQLYPTFRVHAEPAGVLFSADRGDWEQVRYQTRDRNIRLSGTFSPRLILFVACNLKENCATLHRTLRAFRGSDTVNFCAAFFASADTLVRRFRTTNPIHSRPSAARASP